MFINNLNCLFENKIKTLLLFSKITVSTVKFPVQNAQFSRISNFKLTSVDFYSQNNFWKKQNETMLFMCYYKIRSFLILFK